MKNILLVFVILFGRSAIAQSITINPDLVVSATYLDVSQQKLSTPTLANIIANRVEDDTLSNLYVMHRGYCIWGLTVAFRNDSIIPQYYYWDDGGGKITLLNFDSYELTLNARTYKTGDRLMGRFKGVVTEKDSVKSRTYNFSGKFYCIAQDNIDNYRRQGVLDKNQLQKKWQSKKRYRDTGIYELMDGKKALELDLPPYELGPDKEEYFPKSLYVSLAAFTQVTSAPGKQKNTTDIILKINPDALATTTVLFAETPKVALLHKNTILSAAQVTVKNSTLTFTIPVSKKEEVAKIVADINAAISKAAAGKK